MIVFVFLLFLKNNAAGLCFAITARTAKELINNNKNTNYKKSRRTMPLSQNP